MGCKEKMGQERIRRIDTKLHICCQTDKDIVGQGTRRYIQIDRKHNILVFSDINR